MSNTLSPRVFLTGIPGLPLLQQSLKNGFGRALSGIPGSGLRVSQVYCANHILKNIQGSFIASSPIVAVVVRTVRHGNLWVCRVAEILGAFL